MTWRQWLRLAWAGRHGWARKDAAEAMHVLHYVAHAFSRSKVAIILADKWPENGEGPVEVSLISSIPPDALADLLQSARGEALREVAVRTSIMH